MAARGGVGGNRHGRARGLDHPARGRGRGGEGRTGGGERPSPVVGARVRAIRSEKARLRGFACGFGVFFSFLSALYFFFPWTRNEDEVGEAGIR